MKILSIILLMVNVTIANGQKIYKDVTKSKDEILKSSYDKLYKGSADDDYSFGYAIDDKYGQENVQYYVNEKGLIYKVIYIAEHANDGYRRYTDLVKKLSIEDFRTIDIESNSVYAKNTTYYDGYALYKFGKKNINGYNVMCFTILLDKTP